MLLCKHSHIFKHLRTENKKNDNYPWACDRERRINLHSNTVETTLLKLNKNLNLILIKIF
jgi:hypothetical protein